VRKVKPPSQVAKEAKRKAPQVVVDEADKEFFHKEEVAEGDQRMAVPQAEAPATEVI